MANIRIRPNGIIQYDFCIFGVRFRETSGLPATPKNIKITKDVLKRLNAELALGTFEYRDFFPESKKVAKFEALQRAKNPESRYPYFDNYARAWLERQAHRWKNSYYHTVRIHLEKYLFPTFKNTLVGDITLAQLELFRKRLAEQTKPDGRKRFTNAHINHIVGPLITILSLAAQEHDFPYPFRCYKNLREEKPESNPMTLNEVKLFLTVVDPEWHDYYLLRFFTGMRSCEVHGLQIENLDFQHRLIRIRHNWVNGELTTVKTPKSRRDIPMSEPVYQALQRVVARKNNQSPHVFTQPDGKPMDTRWVSQYLWYPTLKKAGLGRRRPYETRHTAAVLHIAAHENPMYVSSMLGHSTTKLLFEVYAPYVVNVARNDGSAFTNMMQQQGIG